MYELNSRIVFLHVEHDNVAARKFYERLGYVDVSVGDREGCNGGDTKEDGFISISLNEPSQSSVVIEDDTIVNQQHDMIVTLDTKQLAINAGTVGQLLMMKRLSKESIPNDQKDVFKAEHHPREALVINNK